MFVKKLNPNEYNKENLWLNKNIINMKLKAQKYLIYLIDLVQIINYKAHEYLTISFIVLKENRKEIKLSKKLISSNLEITQLRKLQRKFVLFDIAYKLEFLVGSKVQSLRCNFVKF